MSRVASRAAGFMLLEVLVAIVILVLGLLGLLGFQVRATTAETEAYQRAQAMILAQDMVERIYANRSTYLYCPAITTPSTPTCLSTATSVTPPAGALVPTSGPVGASVQDCANLTGYALDICQWNNALVGTAEKLGTANVGTLRVARGCITNPANNVYVVTVAWQGLVPTATPADSTAAACAANIGGDTTLQRAVQMQAQISSLSLVP